jgi:hypothetical protein
MLRLPFFTRKDGPIAWPRAKPTSGVHLSYAGIWVTTFD